MKKGTEKVGILYCERAINPANFPVDLRLNRAYRANASKILGRYEKAAKRIEKRFRMVRVETEVKEDYGPALILSGPPDELGKALTDVFSGIIPPETQVGIPETDSGPSTEAGYKLAENILRTRGHRIIPPVETDFEIVVGYFPILRK